MLSEKNYNWSDTQKKLKGGRIMNLKRLLFFRSENKATIISWTLVIIWMVVIFAFSAEPGINSNSLSKWITKGFNQSIEKSKVLNPPTNQKKQTATAQVSNSEVRDTAHATVYLVLGFLALNAFRRNGFKGFQVIANSFLLCAIYAWSDEFHQLFVPARVASFKDISLDFAGAMLGIGLFYLTTLIFRKFKR